MLNTLVSLKSYVGTIIIFILFIISFVVMVATMSVPNVKFLTIPLTISLGIALMKSVVYLNGIIKLKEDNVNETDEQQQFFTCPEYWIKSVMYNQEPNGDYTPVNVCKNAYPHPENKNKTRYVSGSAIEVPENSNQSSFFTNFKSGYSNADSSLTNVNDLLNAMNSNNVVSGIEGFTDESTVYDGTAITQLGSESNGFIIRNDPKNINSDRRVLYTGSSNYDSQSNSSLNIIPGAHYHYISSMTRHSNNDILHPHAETTGAVYHWHDDQVDSRYDLKLSGECLSNWICKDTTNDNDGGLIINLDNLNTFNNESLCKHGTQFHWVEAMNKCDVVSHGQ